MLRVNLEYCICLHSNEKAPFHVLIEVENISLESIQNTLINEMEESKRQSVFLESDKRDTSGSNDSLEDHNESRALKPSYSCDANGNYQYSDAPSETRVLPFTDHYAADLLNGQGKHTHLLEMKVVTPKMHVNHPSKNIDSMMGSSTKQSCQSDGGFKTAPKFEYQLARVSKKRTNLLQKLLCCDCDDQDEVTPITNKSLCQTDEK